jgi:hypothetical protein
MEAPFARRRVTGALEFLAELDLFATECAATGVWDDELTARRRRLREDVEAAESREGSQMKAL